MQICDGAAECYLAFAELKALQTRLQHQAVPETVAMGAAASTAKEEIGSTNIESDSGGQPLTCQLSDEQVHQFVTATHFSADEIVALHIHYDLISSSKREDGLIDRSEFQTALGFTVKESLYVDRIFQLFDANNDSFIGFDEFLQSLSVLSSKGKPDEKLKFSFDVLDFDRDGKLSKQELLSMLEACIQENSINIPKECLETIVDKTIADVDLDQDGFISYDEYKLLGETNPHMLNHITFNISGIIAEYMPALRSMAARIQS